MAGLADFVDDDDDDGFEGLVPMEFDSNGQYVQGKGEDDDDGDVKGAAKQGAEDDDDFVISLDDDDDDGASEEDLEELSLDDIIEEDADADAIDAAGGDTEQALELLKEQAAEISQQKLNYLIAANAAVTQNLNLSEQQFEQAKKKLIAAREEGDTEQEIDAQSAMRAAEDQIRECKKALNDLGDPNSFRDVVNAEYQKKVSVYQQRLSAGAGIQPKNEAAKRFKENNPDIFKDKSMIGMLTAIDADMRENSKYRDDSDEYMDELARRLFVASKGAKPIRTNGGKRLIQRKGKSRVPSMARSRPDVGKARPKPPKRMVITKRDIADASRWGLDIKNNPAERKAFMRERRRTMMEEAANAAG